MTGGIFGFDVHIDDTLVARIVVMVLDQRLMLVFMFVIMLVFMFVLMIIRFAFRIMICVLTAMRRTERSRRVPEVKVC